MKKSGGGPALTSVSSAADRELRYSWHSMASDQIVDSRSCRILVAGIGNSGNNTVTRLKESSPAGVWCVAINTNAACLEGAKADKKVLIGERSTKGLGVRGDPKLGKIAFEESRKSVEDLLIGVDMLFITAGLGGGTGTGGAPSIAEMARMKGIIAIGVVTMPSKKEKGRLRSATHALAQMKKHCDTVIVVDNNRLAQLVPQLPIKEAFRIADRVLADMIRDIVETVSSPSLINLDWTDFKSVMKRGGVAALGMGESDAPNRAEEAVHNALTNPLLDAGYAGATGALVQVTGDNHMTIEEANRVGELVTETLDTNAQVIWGARVSPELEGKLKVTLVMTGIKSPRSVTSLTVVAPQLYNMESCLEHERHLNLDLDLYQMERD